MKLAIDNYLFIQHGSEIGVEDSFVEEEGSHSTPYLAMLPVSVMNNK